LQPILHKYDAPNSVSFEHAGREEDGELLKEWSHAIKELDDDKDKAEGLARAIGRGAKKLGQRALKAGARKESAEAASEDAGAAVLDDLSKLLGGPLLIMVQPTQAQLQGTGIQRRYGSPIS